MQDASSEGVIAETAPARPRHAAFAFILVTVLLDMLALGMIVPILPRLVIDFVGGNKALATDVYGLFGTVWALMQFLFSPVQGALSDRFGLWLGFHNCSQDDYLAMIEGYAVHYGIKIYSETLKSRAIAWAAGRGARSGRVAWQFIQDLAGELGKTL